MSVTASYTMREYKIAKGWAIATYIIVPLMMPLFAALPFVTYQPDKEHSVSSLIFFIAISVGMIAFLPAGLLDAVNRRLIIGDNSITSRTTFSKRTLLFTEIKGYRVMDKFLQIVPAIPNKKSIRVSRYTGGYKEIEQWLSLHFDDVDVRTQREEEEEILNNESFGFTGEERSARLEKARQVCKVLNAIGLLVGLWLFIYPAPYLYALAAGMAMPWVVLLLTKGYKGLIRLNESKGSAYPSLVVAMLMPCLGVFSRALLDYNLYSYAHVWLPAIVITATFAVLLAAGNREVVQNGKNGVVLTALLSLFLFGYSYGVVVITNCYFDASVPTVYDASVLNKRVSTGRHTSYYLTLSPWGMETEADEVDVPRNLYDEVTVNDVVQVYYMNGAFDIPWFEVSR